MSEKRQFSRFASALEFYCYIDGDRFDTVSVGISPSGVFLETMAKVRRGAIVMLVPKNEAAHDFPVMLIGRVIRRQRPPEAPGYGVQWLRCLTKRGMEAIYHFIASYPEFSQLTLPFADPDVMRAQVVGYDFVANRFYVPSVPGKGAPVPPSPFVPEPLTPPPLARPTPPADFSRSQEDGAVTKALKVMHEQIPVSIATSIIVHGEELFGTVVMMSLTTLFVSTAARQIAVGDEVRIRLPVSLAERETIVELLCRVDKLGPHLALAGGTGLHLTITAIDESKRAGLFERYVKYLYYQMLTMR